MEHSREIGTFTLLLILGLGSVSTSLFKESAGSSEDNLVVKGLVSNPLNLTYSELKTFPMIWEIADLQCVYASYGQPYNWTGIPLFYILNLAKVQPDAKEVVFRAEDGFSSSLTLDKAMHPTTILALKVNDTTLPFADYYYSGGLAGGYPYKVVVPCKYGYKWVGWIDEIEVVDYDYKGTYESMGFSDEADIPNCTGLPETTPAYIVFNAAWRETYTLTVFSNAVVLNASFNQAVKHIYFKISSDNDSESFLYIIVPKLLLTSNFTVLSNNIVMQHSLIQSETNSFVHFTLNQGLHLIEINGMLLADVNHDARVDMRDIRLVCWSYGTTPSHERWNPHCDLNEDGKIDMKDIEVACTQYGKRQDS